MSKLQYDFKEMKDKKYAIIIPFQPSVSDKDQSKIKMVGMTIASLEALHIDTIPVPVSQTGA